MTDRHEPRTDERTVPNLVLERHGLGELPAPERDALTRRIDSEPELRERLEALERSDAELRGRFEAGLLAERVRAQLAARGQAARAPAAWWRAWPLPAGLAVATTVALVASLRTTTPTTRVDAPADAPATRSSSTPPPSSARPAPSAAAGASAPIAFPETGEPGVRIKGLPALSLFRKTPDGSETLADGDVARDGDVIRIGYRSFGRRYGVIVSLDGRGGVTRHLPEQGATAAALESSEVVLLAHAYELDDAPAWERFFFVTADAPFQVATVEDAAHRAAGGQAAAGLSLPRPLEQSTFLLMKEPRP